MSTRAALPVIVTFLLAGCSGASGSLGPAAWWGGQRRPAIPGAKAPYPNLADVPKPPHFTPAAERASISARLLADRAHAHQQMVLAPLTEPVHPAPPAPSGVTGAASAELPASPPRAVGEPRPTPAPVSSPALPPKTVAEALTLLPSIPLAPPLPPGVASLPNSPPPPAPGVNTRGPLIALTFAPGSSSLSPADRRRLAALAAERQGKAIAILGYGGARTSGADAQVAALRLALGRAEVIATALAQAGVPADALNLGAEASGSGAVVHFADRT